MAGAKTACAFAPKTIPPMGAGAGGRGRSPMGAGAGALFFAYAERRKKFFQNLCFCVDKHSNLVLVYGCPDETGLAP